ncbi:MAG TPA: alpha/beta hydrolase, partial [Acidimicrobiia bacterium]|nr:alpha/beta hydrolase [Acidimicrobiia bacterium]
MAKRPLPDDLNAQRAEQPIRSIRSSPEPSPDLQEALAVVWHRKWQILAIALLTFGVALFLSSRRTPVYESQVRLLVTPVEGVATDPPSLNPLNMATESELVSSVAVAQIVANDLNIPGPPRDLLGDLSVDNPEDTEILEIGYSDSNPRQAQRISMAFAQAYLQFREETATRAILESAEAIQSEIAVLTQQLESMEQQLQDMSATDPNRSSLEASASLVRSSILDRQLAQAAGLQTALAQVVAEPRNRLHPGDVYLLSFDPNGDGKAAIALGDPTRAAAIGVVVPGMDTTLANIANPLRNAVNLRRTSDSLAGPVVTDRTSMVAWLGYDTPSATQVGFDGKAQAGAPELVGFVDDLRATHTGA